MKKLYLRIISVLFIFNFSCESEQTQLNSIQEVEQYNVQIEKVDFNSVSELSQVLNNEYGKSKLAKSYAKKGESKFWIDEQAILKLKDSVNNESYSIVIHSDEYSENKLYNLIITKRPNGNSIEPFVVEYNFENREPNNILENDEHRLIKTTKIYSFEEFTQVINFESKNQTPIPCMEIDDIEQANTDSSTSSSISSGSGISGNSNGTHAAGTASSFTTNSVIVSWGSSGTKGTVIVGEVVLLAKTTDSDWQKTTTEGSSGKNSNPCPEGEVVIAINEGEKINNEIYNPCVANIINKANAADNSLANDMKNAFGSDESNFNLTYNQKDLQGESLGLTDVYLKNGRIDNITVWLDSGFLEQGSDVAIFSVVIHENMHSLMFYQLDQRGIAPDDPDTNLSILADQWSEEVAQNINGQLPPSDLAYIQHEIMSGLVETMAGYINNFARSKGYQIDDIQAMALAWTGLHDSIAWTFMDEELRKAYENLIDNEVTGFEILSVGTKCR